MHITILTIGSRRGVQPYVALGEGLKKAGYRVHLATHDCFEPFVRSRELDFFSIAGDPRGTLEGETGLKWLESNKNPFTFVKRMVAAAKPVLWQIMNDYWKACQETEAVLFPTLAALPAASIVEKLQTPAYRAYLQHVHPTRVYPGPLAMPLQHLGGFYNKLTYSIGGSIFWQFMWPIINRWRKEVLNLPPYPFKSSFGKAKK